MKNFLLTLCFIWIPIEAFPEELASDKQFEQALTKIKKAELPAEVAAIIKKSKAADLEKTTVLVIEAAVAVNPAAAAVIVGATARSRPEVVSLAAATAARLQPKQAAAIARAAVSAVPAQAARIVGAICLSVPEQCRSVALAVSTAAPEAAKEILRAVAAAVPQLGPMIEAALAESSSSKISVAAILDDAIQAMEPPTAQGPQPLGPKIGPPFVPLAGTVKTITPGTSHEVPPGGRNYARP